MTLYLVDDDNGTKSLAGDTVQRCYVWARGHGLDREEWETARDKLRSGYPVYYLCVSPVCREYWAQIKSPHWSTPARLTLTELPGFGAEPVTVWEAWRVYRKEYKDREMPTEGPPWVEEELTPDTAAR